MDTRSFFDAIIVGGSYAGLSAGLTLGRSLRKTLILDGGNPCNKPSKAAHNLLTHDGQSPARIREKAVEQVLAYPTVSIRNTSVTNVEGQDGAFFVETTGGDTFQAKKLLFATGLEDILPAIRGFSDCWGKSILHCPYCHGYEVRGERTAIIASGIKAVHFTKLLHNWTNDLVVISNGEAEIDPDHEKQMSEWGVPHLHEPIDAILSNGGQLEGVRLQSGEVVVCTAAYAHLAFRQKSNLPERIGCRLNDQGILSVDDFQRTSVTGVFAAGDNSFPLRAIASSLSTGMRAGAAINMDLIGGLLPG